MRVCPLLLVAAAACNLYVADGAPDDAVPGPIDAPASIDARTVRGCRGGPIGPSSLPPGTVRYASRLATAANELAWDVARAPDGASYVAGEVAGPPPTGLLACFEPDGTLGWSEADASVARWVGLVVDPIGAPVVLGDLAGGGAVVRRVRLDGDPRAPWEVRVDGATLTSIAARGDGGVLVAGRFTGVVEVEGASVRSVGGSDAVLVALDGDGGVVSVRRFGGTADDGVDGVAVTAGGDVVVAAHTASATLDLTTAPLPAAGGLDALVVQLAPSGAVAWAHRFGGASDDTATGVAVDERGGVFLAAAITDTDLGAGPVSGAAIVAYDDEGARRWATPLVSPIVRLWSVAAAAGKAYTVGVYFQPATLGGMPLPGTQTTKFVAELTETGAPGWLVRGDGPTLGAALEVGPSVLVAGPYLVNFDMGGVHLDPSTPHDIYAMEIER